MCRTDVVYYSAGILISRTETESLPEEYDWVAGNISLVKKHAGHVSMHAYGNTKTYESVPYLRSFNMPEYSHCASPLSVMGKNDQLHKVSGNSNRALYN
jgi:hypothetical protein